MSNSPSLSARNATNLPSGEISAPSSVPSQFVSSLNRAQVVGLHITVDDVPFVCRGQSLGDLARVVDRTARWERPTEQTASQRFAFEQFGNDVRRAGVPADIEDRHDIGMIQLPGGASLLLETLHPARVGGHGFGDQLDRHVATEARVARAVDDPMPPAPSQPTIS